MVKFFYLRMAIFIIKKFIQKEQYYVLHFDSLFEISPSRTLACSQKHCACIHEMSVEVQSRLNHHFYSYVCSFFSVTPWVQTRGDATTKRREIKSVPQITVPTTKIASPIVPHNQLTIVN